MKTITQNKLPAGSALRPSPSAPSGSKVSLVVLFLTLVVLRATGAGPTIVSSPLSGTWDAQGSPYIVADNCTIPGGQTLIIEPNTTVIIGSNITITVDGVIQANGIPSKPITFRGPNELTYWGQIKLREQSGSFFHHCSFSEATTALSFYVSWDNTMEVEVLNCAFRNCLESCVLGVADGWGSKQAAYTAKPSLIPVFKNCIFQSAETGIKLQLNGSLLYYSGGGRAFPIITTSIFENLELAAVKLSATSHTRTSGTVGEGVCWILDHPKGSSDPPMVGS